MEDQLITIPPRQVSILAGASGSGKTTLLTQEIKEWTEGREFTQIIRWSESVKSIAYLVSDRTKSEVEWRLKRLGVSEDRVEVWGLQDDLSFKLDLLKTPAVALSSILNTKFKRRHQMLIIDPIALFIEDNTNDFRGVAISLMKVGRIAVEHDITIFATHHATKQRTDFAFKRPQDRISGSGAFQGYSGTQMVLIEGREDDLPYDTLWVIPHLGPARSVQMKRNEKGDFERHDIIAAATQRVQLVKDFILQSPGVVNIGDLHKMGDDIMLPRQAVKRLIGEMVEKGEIERVGVGEYKNVRIGNL